MKASTPKFLLVLTVILAATVFRVLPHWPNFTPLAAIALLSGAFVSNRVLSLLMPLMAMLISDIVTISLVNAQWTTASAYFTDPGTLLIYVSYMLMTLIGMRLQHNQSAGKLAISGLACSILFFVLSNFGVWMVNTLPKNFGGLLQTYALGIPFFSYDLAGNIFYTFAAFGLIRILMNTWPSLRMQTLKS
jgi:hypothetical protein